MYTLLSKASTIDDGRDYIHEDKKKAVHMSFHNSQWYYSTKTTTIQLTNDKSFSITYQVKVVATNVMKEKNTSVRQRKNVETLIGQNSVEKKRKRQDKETNKFLLG